MGHVLLWGVGHWMVDMLWIVTYDGEKHGFHSHVRFPEDLEHPEISLKGRKEATRFCALYRSITILLRFEAATMSIRQRCWCGFSINTAVEPRLVFNMRTSTKVLSSLNSHVWNPCVLKTRIFVWSNRALLVKSLACQWNSCVCTTCTFLIFSNTAEIYYFALGYISKSHKIPWNPMKPHETIIFAWFSRQTPKLTQVPLRVGASHAKATPGVALGQGGKDPVPQIGVAQRG